MKYAYGALAKDFSRGFLTVSMGNKKGFTNGKFLDFNELPEKLMKLKSMAEMEKRGIGNQAKTLLPYVREAKIESAMAKESKEGVESVVQLNEGVFIRKLYHDYFAKHYPKAEFYTTEYGDRPVVAKNGRKIQGIVMPYVIEGKSKVKKCKK